MSKSNTEVYDFMKLHGACEDGRKWALTKPTMAAVFDACERGDWLMWVLNKAKALDKPTSVRLACEFALRVLPNYEAKYSRKEPRLAIEAALRWIEDRTDENARAAYSAARAARAAARAAYSASDSAACAAYSAASAACAAYSAARAADSAASAACAADSAADSAEQKAQCEIIRKIVKNPWRK